MASAGDVKPDFSKGISTTALKDRDMILGQLDGEDVLLARVGGEFFATGAHCTHYHGALVDGLLVGDTVRCPLHHACFSLRNGSALRAPALDPIACWRVERQGETVFVREKLSPVSLPKATGAAVPESVVIVGGGGAGLAAADMLRREGYGGSVTIVSADDSPPCDRPNLSKEYLSGEAPEDWIPLRAPEFYSDNNIDLVLGSHVTSIDVRAKQVVVEGGRSIKFGALLMATGAEPVHLSIPGSPQIPIHYLRTFADSRAIIAKTAGAARAVVIGASFIGLEVAASLRTRQIEVDVVAPEKRPLERILGPEVGQVIREIHDAHGVTFHLGETVAHIEGRAVTLSGGRVVEADLVVLGVGVKPAVALAEQAGLALDRGIAVNEFLETSAPGVFAAGDAARWLDRRSGERRRVEHWVVAERQGQVAARNILGRREPFDAAPFFWSQHYDVTIRYVGYAETWDSLEVDGSLAARDCLVSYKRGGRRVAVATFARDRENLRAEVEMES